MRRPMLLAAALSATLSIAACGGTNQADQVRSTVRDFAHAVAAHDYANLCHRVLAPQLLADIGAGGLTCEQAMKIGLAGVRDARVTIGSVKVNGQTASVLTLSQAKGESTLLTTLRLIHTSAGWRIASLGHVG